MIQACWKCKSKIDTREVDTSVTVGLCGRCYAHFDDPEVPVVQATQATEEPKPVASSEQQTVGFDLGTGQSTTTLQTMSVSPGGDNGEIILIVATIDPTMNENIAITRTRMMEALQVPEEYLNPPPFGPPGTADRMAYEISQVVENIKNNFIDNGKTSIEEMKQVLRRESIAVLRRNAPVGVMQDFVEKIVDECIERAFADVQPAPSALVAATG